MFGPLVSLLVCAPLWATSYHVGPGQALSTLGAAPWATLAAGDTVYIHYQATPYREKLVLAVEGTAAKPIVIYGVKGPGGELPMLRGDNATTPNPLNFWSEGRGIIKFGGSNTPSADPTYVYLENLDISGARQENSFSDDGDAVTAYGKNAAGIFVESGSNLVIRNCYLHDNGNGLFIASGASKVLVEGNTIKDNGVEGSIYEHNSYTESNGITFQYNQYGALCDGCPGNNLKDRSAGTVIRYNIIDGGNRQLDLVESDHEELYNLASYRNTFVYGNLLIERDGSGNRQVVHYGGDNGDESMYRKGTLHFYHNTVYSDRTDRTTLIRLSSAEESADVRNNVVYLESGGGNLEVLADGGNMELRHNWLPTGWVKSFTPVGTVSTPETNIVGANPTFSNLAQKDFSPAKGSSLIGGAGPLASATSNYAPLQGFTSGNPPHFQAMNATVIGAFLPAGSATSLQMRRNLPPSMDLGLRYNLLGQHK